MSRPNPFLEDFFPEFDGLPTEERDMQDSGFEVIHPRQNVLAIGDLHGNAKALQHTLRAANLTIPTISLSTGKASLLVTNTGKQYSVVQTGDIFDRNSTMLECLDDINDLRAQGLDFRCTAGNHEIDALYNFCSPSFKADSDEFYDFAAQTVQQLEKLQPHQSKRAHIKKIRYSLQQSQQLTQSKSDALSFLSWFYDGGSTIGQEFAEKYNTDPTSIFSLLQTGDEIFFEDGEYADLVRSINAMEQIDDVLFLHGGIDDTWAELLEKAGSVDELNKQFRQEIAQQNLAQYAYGDKTGLFWQRWNNGPILSAKAVKVLKKLGINAVIRGHDAQPGIQTQHNIEGIIIINNDIGNGVCTNPGGTIINAAGDIIGFNYDDFDNKSILARLPSIHGIRAKTAGKALSFA